MDHVRTFSLGTCAHFNNFEWESLYKTITLQDRSFVVVPSFSWFPSKDSHQFPLKRNVFSSFLWKLSLFPKELHTFCKLSLACIKMIGLKITKPSLFPKELYTCAKMSHIIIKVHFLNLDKHCRHAVYVIREYTHLRSWIMLAPCWSSYYFLRINTHFESWALCASRWSLSILRNVHYFLRNHKHSRTSVRSAWRWNL